MSASSDSSRGAHDRSADDHRDEHDLVRSDEHPGALVPAEFATRLRAPAGAPLITFSVCRYPPGQRFWALRQMGLARRPLAHTPGLGFHRLLGSGGSPGFSLRPDLGRYALLAVWSSEQAADDFFAASRLLASWRAHASELWTVKLLPRRTRGSWSGHTPFTGPPLDLDPDLPSVVITRASLRLRALLSFWRRVPAINRGILQSPGLRLALGVGELPWLRPVTVSLWDDDAALERFAYHGSCHHHAARAAIDRRWFREDLFARFAAIASQGRVDGRDPCGFQALAAAPTWPAEHVLSDMSHGPATLTAS